jgi:hypothetical protein
MNSHDNREEEEYQGNRQAPRPGVIKLIYLLLFKWTQINDLIEASP